MPRKPASNYRRKPASRGPSSSVRAPARKALSGRGFYKGFGRQVGSAIGSAVGKYAGSRVGLSGPMGAIGGHLGAWLGNKASQMTGWGAYKLKRNSLMSTIPRIHNPSREGATQIRHTEFLGDVLSSTEFTTQFQIPINAALDTSFPWLSQVAHAYQQYEVNGMAFVYKNTSGASVASANTSLGSVYMATQYDSIAGIYTTEQQMLNSEFSISTVPSEGALHFIECAPGQTTIDLLYTRVGPVPPHSDARLYDLGIFQLATHGQQVTGASIGQLFVTYDILLYKPILLPSTETEPQAYGLAYLTDVDGGHPYGNNFDSDGFLVFQENHLDNQFQVEGANIILNNTTSVQQTWIVTLHQTSVTDASGNISWQSPIFDDRGGSYSPIFLNGTSTGFGVGSPTDYVFQLCMTVPPFTLSIANLAPAINAPVGTVTGNLLVELYSG